MNSPASWYAIPLILSAIVSAVTVGVIWRQRQSISTPSIIALMLGLCVWSMTYAFHWIADDPATRHFWLQASYLGVVTVPTALWSFSQHYSNRAQWLKLSRRVVMILAIEPLLTLILLWTDPLHGLFYGGKATLNSGAILDGGVWFWINIVYSYGLILWAFGIFVLAFWRAPRLYRNQAGAIMLAALVPLIGNVVGLLGFNPAAGLDLTPFLFTFTGLVFTFNLLRFRLLDIMPVARHLVVERMLDGVLVVDDLDRIVDINPAAQKLLKTNPVSALGRPVNSVAANWPALLAMLQYPGSAHNELVFTNSSGKINFDVQIIPLNRQSGRLVIWRDQTQSKKAAEGLRVSEQRYRRLMENAAFPVIVTHFNTDTLLYFNQRAVDIYRLTAEDLGNSALPFFANPNDRDRLIAQLLTEGSVADFDVTLNVRTGATRWALISASRIDYEGQPAVLSSLNDITDRKKAEEELLNLSRAVEQSASTIVITSLDGAIEFANPAFTHSTGYTIEEALGQNPRILNSGLLPKETYTQMWQTLASGATWQGEFHNRRKDGSLYWESSIISPIKDKNGQIQHYLAIKDDITERKQAQQDLQIANQTLRDQLEQIEHLQANLQEQAIRDPLTNLYNRRYLNETLPRELARAERENYPVSFVLADIDGFKNFNDRYGHAAGDVVLTSLAGCLLLNIRTSDFVCRYGGEEFLAVMPNTSLEIALERAEQWRSAFAAALPVYEDQILQATISLGVAAYPAQGETFDQLFSAVDAALYRAKAAGRNCVRG